MYFLTSSFVWLFSSQNEWIEKQTAAGLQGIWKSDLGFWLNKTIPRDCCFTLNEDVSTHLNALEMCRANWILLTATDEVTSQHWVALQSM